MDVIQIVNRAFEQEQKKGNLAKEAVKKTIEKIVDEFAKMKPTSQEEHNAYVMEAATLVILIGQKANALGIITPEEVCQEFVKAFAKHSLDNK